MLIVVTVVSYFETLLKKNDNVPPIREENPKKSETNPNIITIIAIHRGILFFSSQVMGCMQMMLMKSASKKGAMIVFAYIAPAKMMINAASFIIGEPSIDPNPLSYT